MIKHANDQVKTWDAPASMSPQDAANEIAWLKRGIHDPLSFNGGLSWRSVISWRLLGEIIL